MIPIAQIINLIDLTDLSHDPYPEKRITSLCKKARDAQVAAVCVYPQEVIVAKKALQGSSIPVATVANFPSANESLDAVTISILNSIKAGADEIDVVLPYPHLIQNDLSYVESFIKKCRELTAGHCLKVIIESGVLNNEQILTATSIVCDNDADFVKTSTGKIKDKGASLAAVESMLSVLVEKNKAKTKHTGIKISGGVMPENVQAYLSCIEKSMKKNWITPKHVRLGASALLEGLLSQI